MPSYLGLAHHASTSFNCCSYSASSAAPAFSSSGSNWKESDGKAVEMGWEMDGRAAVVRDDIVKGLDNELMVLTAATRRGSRQAALRNIMYDGSKRETCQFEIASVMAKVCTGFEALEVWGKCFWCSAVVGVVVWQSRGKVPVGLGSRAACLIVMIFPGQPVRGTLPLVSTPRSGFMWWRRFLTPILLCSSTLENCYISQISSNF